MKLTKKDLKEITTTAKLLPEQFEYGMMTLLGATIKDRKDLDFLDKSNINPRKYYRVQNPNNKIAVNHVNRMKSAFKANGAEGVRNYLSQFRKKTD